MSFVRVRPLESYKRLLNFPQGGVHIVAMLPRSEYVGGDIKPAYRVCKNFGEWYVSVKGFQEAYDGSNVRIYTSYNPRNIKTGAVNVMKRYTDSINTGDYSFVCKNDLLISSLKKKGTALKRDYFLLDCDSEEAFDFVSENLRERIVDIIKTPNGYHVLVKPFDVSLLEGVEGLDIKKDEFLFVDLV